MVTADLGYDHASGLYLGASAVTDLNRAAVIGLQGNIGYARRLSPTLSIDGGVVRSEYLSSFSGGRAAHYTELYLGLTRRSLSARAYYSPDYFRTGARTLYGEVEGVIHPAAQWRLNGHVGALTRLGALPLYTQRTSYDWRLGVTRQLGHFDVHAAVSGGGPGADYYAGRRRDRTALVVGAAWVF
ncbi:MAG: hypothetical protein JWN66_4126 [Sphingomonas bacterium]|nr:hypothetical protein [Sphingomonas bacterium]